MSRGRQPAGKLKDGVATTVVVEADVMDDIRAIAEREDRSVAYVIRVLVSDGLRWRTAQALAQGEADHG